MPYRSWCPTCVKAKGQPVHHRRGGLKEQSVHTVLTCVETMTGLCMAIPTSRKGVTRHQLTQLKKFVMENGFIKFDLVD
eukprot:4002864-Amphidinium_carterae.1